MSSSLKRKDIWKNDERYYCACCNVWMGSDRMSIAIHENGKKHKEAMEASVLARRKDKLKEESDKKSMEQTMRMIHEAADKRHRDDVMSGTFTGSAVSASTSAAAVGNITTSIGMDSTRNIVNQQLHTNTGAGTGTGTDISSKGELKSWKDRKQKRSRSDPRSMTSGNTANDADDDDDETILAKKRKKQRLVLIQEKLISLNNYNNVGNDDHQQQQQRQQHLKHPKNIDHYSVGENIYLQCPLYSSLLEVEMPVEIWTGSSTTTIQHRMGTVTGSINQSAAGTGTASVDEIQSLWKMGIVMKVHRNDDDANQTTATVTTETIDTINSHIKCDVSYLKDINDNDETIERKVDGTRLRILLGCDDMIPSTVEEARVALLGIEEGSGDIGIEDATSNGNTSMPISAPVMDEDTGLSSWTTTSVRKVTVSQQVKEERARARAKRKEQFEKQEQEKKDAQGRKMEEERYVNAHDSALGAYDVWSSAGRVGYKGVQIGTTGSGTGSGSGSGGANDDAAVGLGSSASGGKLAANNGRVGVRFKKRNGAAGGRNTVASKFKRSQKKQNRRKTFVDDSDED
eukprot:CAMPEP_0194108100 /NCGR_PEP_ID=MMETSP0150-20130528/7860_1 /TAXON_ID=122233 /ORGANISM="Chaetoceros debilis, Strain MM31A-1" /LENGTH=571 /DNA_ID=CAMNT_0038796711 /DNA_START=26 /DNA_END=1741 /DNA_ORIENTATION=+